MSATVNEIEVLLLKENSKHKEGAKNGVFSLNQYFKAIIGSTSGQRRVKIGSKSGYNLSNNLVKLLANAQKEQSTQDRDAKKQAYFLLCETDILQKLNSLNADKMAIYIYVFEQMIAEIKAGQAVEIGKIVDKITSQEKRVSRKLITNKIVDIFVQKGILVKPSEKKYHWLAVENKQHHLKGFYGIGQKFTDINAEKLSDPSVTLCDSSVTLSDARKNRSDPSVTMAVTSVTLSEGIALTLKKDYVAVTHALRQLKGYITPYKVKILTVTAAAGFALNELIKSFFEINNILMFTPFFIIGAAAIYHAYWRKKLNTQQQTGNLDMEYANIKVINGLDQHQDNNPQIKSIVSIPKIKDTISCKTVPQTGVKLGTDDNGNVAYWGYNDPKLKNKHLLVLGASGGGKTYALQKILKGLGELIEKSSIIFDFKPSFRNSDLESNFILSNKPKQHFLVNTPISINPLKSQKVALDVDMFSTETNYEVASRVASIFKSVYSTMGDQQQSTLANAIEAGINANPDFIINDLSAELKKTETEYTDDGKEKIVPLYKGGENIANKIDPFIKAGVFNVGEFDWGDLFINQEGHRSHVIQLHGLNNTVKNITCEFLMEDLYSHINAAGNKNNPSPIVIDECHNVNFKKGSPARKALKEGRSFGLSMILATQGLVEFDKIEQSALMQAATIMLFEPMPSEMKDFAKLLTARSNKNIEFWQKVLSGLGLGQSLVLDNYGIRKVNIEVI